jgi:glycosyltransferase involved in cell wall biosynthesis
MIKGLAEQGVPSEVVSLDAPDTQWAKADPFPLHALEAGNGPWHYSNKLVPWLTDNLARFDAVILHGLWLFSGYALRKAVRRYKAQHQSTSKSPAIFVMPHGMLDPYFQRATGRKLKALRNWAYWKVIEAPVVNEADGVLFTCETERLLAREPFAPYRPQKQLVVGLGVEAPPPYTAAMQEAFLAKCPELRNRPYILFLSRIHEKKGVELLVQAYDRLASQQPSAVAVPVVSGDAAPDYHELPTLVIAGPGLETAYGQEILQLASKLPESASVYFPGMLTGDAKWGAFYGSEAFVLPSHQENFGIAVVEALACSKPVLISNQVNIWREIEAAGGGLVADDTKEGTFTLLERWCKLTEQQKLQFGEKARTAYLDCFALKPASEKMQAALQLHSSSASS